MSERRGEVIYRSVKLFPKNEMGERGGERINIIVKTLSKGEGNE